MEPGRYLLLRETPEIGELKNPALVVGETAERSANPRLVLVQLGGRLRIFGAGREDGFDDGFVRLRGRLERRAFAPQAAPPGPAFIDRAIAGNTHHPAEESSSRRHKEIRMTPDPQEHVLGRILGELGVPKDAKGRHVDQVGVPVVEGVEGYVIVSGDCAHQGFVGPFGTRSDGVPSCGSGDFSHPTNAGRLRHSGSPCPDTLPNRDDTPAPADPYQTPLPTLGPETVAIYVALGEEG